MSSHGTTSARIFFLPEPKEIQSILDDPVGHEIICAILRENAYLRQKNLDLEEEAKFSTQLHSGMAHDHTQSVLDLHHSQKTAEDLQTSINILNFKLWQQAAILTNIREEITETSRSMEREKQDRMLINEQLEAVRHSNAQFMGFFKALRFMKREELEILVVHDFNGVLANHPTIAHRVEKMKQDHAAMDEALETYGGMHQQLVDMIQRLISLVGVSDVVEIATASVGIITRATPC